MKSIKNKVNDCEARKKSGILSRGNCYITKAKCNYKNKEDCHLYHRYVAVGFKK